MLHHLYHTLQTYLPLVISFKINAIVAKRAFPCLFPFRHGGIEADRPEEVSFGEHAKWALRYHDHRFRKHETFPFVAFDIQQR